MKPNMHTAILKSVRYRRKTTGFKIIILLLTIFDGIMGCRRNGLSEHDGLSE
jgi:hypothetical protein